MPIAKTITLGARTFDLHVLTGEVMESQKWSTTEVWGGGGSGYVHNGNGYSSTSPVRSNCTTHDQLFIRSADGTDTAVQFADVNLAARKGHQISLVWAIPQGESRGPYVATLNHVTNSADSPAGSVKGVAVTKLQRAASHPFVIFMLVMGVLSGGAGLLMIPALGFATRAWKAAKSQTKELTTAINTLADELKATSRITAGEGRTQSVA